VSAGNAGPAKIQRGTTMIEIMVTVAFLAVCAAAIADGVGYSHTQAAYAYRRSVIVSRLQDEIEKARGLAAQATLVAGTSNSTATVTGVEGAVSIKRVTSLHQNSTSLFDVAASATWSDPSFGGVRADTASLTTIIRQ